MRGGIQHLDPLVKALQDQPGSFNQDPCALRRAAFGVQQELMRWDYAGTGWPELLRACNNMLDARSENAFHDAFLEFCFLYYEGRGAEA